MPGLVDRRGMVALPVAGNDSRAPATADARLIAVRDISASAAACPVSSHSPAAAPSSVASPCPVVVCCLMSIRQFLACARCAWKSQLAPSVYARDASGNPSRARNAFFGVSVIVTLHDRFPACKRQRFDSPLPARRQRQQCRSKRPATRHGERSARKPYIPANAAAKRAGALPVTGCYWHCAMQL